MTHDTKNLNFEVDFECGISYMSMEAINITLSVEECWVVEYVAVAQAQAPTTV